MISPSQSCSSARHRPSPLDLFAISRIEGDHDHEDDLNDRGIPASSVVVSSSSIFSISSLLPHRQAEHEHEDEGDTGRGIVLAQPSATE
jgi:hypothetical protein